MRGVKYFDVPFGLVEASCSLSKRSEATCFDASEAASNLLATSSLLFLLASCYY